MFTDPVHRRAFADIKYLKKKSFISHRDNERASALSPLRCRRGKQAKTASRTADVCRHVGLADVRTCTGVCVRTRLLAPFRRLVGGGERRSQRAAGPMPDEIMNLSNGILGNGG